VNESPKNCDKRNGEEGGGEEDEEREGQQQQQQQHKTFGYQILQLQTNRNPNVQQTQTKYGGKKFYKRYGTSARAMLNTAASQIVAPPGSMVLVTISVQKPKDAPNYLNEDLAKACRFKNDFVKKKGEPK